MLTKKGWKYWLKGLISAVVGGMANSVAVSAIAPETFNFQEGFNKLLLVCVVSGIISAANYLKESPVPD